MINSAATDVSRSGPGPLAGSFDPAPIGVFDSGIGGLTVLRALRQALPDEQFLYLGDTARLPYGTKSAATVQRYAVQAAGILVRRGVKAVVVACNTASAVALDALQERYAPLPVFGVLKPGAHAAAATGAGRIIVLATESTIAGGAYQRALLGLRPTLQVFGRPCPLLVTLAEEGRHTGPLVEWIVRDYLQGLLPANARSVAAGVPAATLLLGCTHFPVFREAIEAVLGANAADVVLVDSAATTAAAVAAELAQGLRVSPAPGTARAAIKLLATDGAARFRRVGRYFLDGADTAAGEVELVDL